MQLDGGGGGYLPHLPTFVGIAVVTRWVSSIFGRVAEGKPGSDSAIPAENAGNACLTPGLRSRPSLSEVTGNCVF